MNRRIVEWRIILRRDAVERSFLARPFRHPSLSWSSRLLNHQLPVVANSIPWSGPNMLLGTYLRVTDEQPGHFPLPGAVARLDAADLSRDARGGRSCLVRDH